MYVHFLLCKTYWETDNPVSPGLSRKNRALPSLLKWYCLNILETRLWQVEGESGPDSKGCPCHPWVLQTNKNEPIGPIQFLSPWNYYGFLWLTQAIGKYLPLFGEALEVQSDGGCHLEHRVALLSVFKYTCIKVQFQVGRHFSLILPAPKISYSSWGYTTYCFKHRFKAGETQGELKRAGEMLLKN